MVDISVSLIRKAHGNLSATDLERLDIIQLNNYGIQEIDNLEVFDHIRELHLSGNRIRVVENLEYLRKLEYLDLSNNCIDSAGLRKALGRLPASLQTLVLGGNPCCADEGLLSELNDLMPQLGIVVGLEQQQQQQPQRQQQQQQGSIEFSRRGGLRGNDLELAHARDGRAHEGKYGEQSQDNDEEQDAEGEEENDADVEGSEEEGGGEEEKGGTRGESEEGSLPRYGAEENADHDGHDDAMDEFLDADAVLKAIVERKCKLQNFPPAARSLEDSIQALNSECAEALLLVGTRASAARSKRGSAVDELAQRLKQVDVKLASAPVQSSSASEATAAAGRPTAARVNELLLSSQKRTADSRAFLANLRENMLKTRDASMAKVRDSHK
jgi:hypothetical protein